jgi:IPT/TIG domain-containing protein
MRSILTRALAMPLAGLVFSGCAGMTARHLGIRPDEPESGVTSKGLCAEYQVYHTYAQQLQEAYRSRATQNRWWIYIAGIIGLGTVAASGGLAAAAAATTTIAYLSVSGGFTAGVFATLDNSTLAEIYTIAANKVDTALVEADMRLTVTKSAKSSASGCAPGSPPGSTTGSPPDSATGSTMTRYEDEPACKTALDFLHKRVSKARTALEEARTDSAKAALQRSAAQQQALQQTAAQFAATNPTLVSASITDITPTTFVTSGTSVTLTVTMGAVQQTDLTVGLGDQLVPVTELRNSGSTWQVSFVAPELPPGSYGPVLIVGENELKIENKSGKKLKY